MTFAFRTPAAVCLQRELFDIMDISPNNIAHSRRRDVHYSVRSHSMSERVSDVLARSRVHALHLNILILLIENVRMYVIRHKLIIIGFT